MENYSEIDIARIINDCEILILPENSSIEEILTDESSHLLGNICAAGKSESVKLSMIEEQSDATEEDFEKIYQQTCMKRRSKEVS